MQRDAVNTLKREIINNLRLLNKIYPMPRELPKPTIEEKAWEKPSQSLFNHLSYYLVSIIDFPAASALPWPLYDSKAERIYRNALAAFIANYSSKGLLAPVMSSYLVNPGTYKVTFLTFQMSQLAVEKALVTRMKKEHHKKLYENMKHKYETQPTDTFIIDVKKETELISSKFSNYLKKRKTSEEIAAILRQRIICVEEKQKKADLMLNNLVDSCLKNITLDDETKAELLKIKDVKSKPKFFDSFLELVDASLDKMETEWNNRTSGFLTTCQETVQNTKDLIDRYTGEIDTKSYTMEYNHKTDYFCTKNLQSEVNTEQQYVLKNIIKENKLNFPYLIKGFVISVCFILKNAEIDDDIYKFNEFMRVGLQHYKDAVLSMKMLNERIVNAETRLQGPTKSFNQLLSTCDTSEIPPIPDLSGLTLNREYHNIPFDAFTPNLTKHQFNLHRKVTGFSKPMPQFVTPFHASKEDFKRSMISCRISCFDQTLNISNVSVIAHQTNRANETIASCSTGFTKQQLVRLLSTKKSSSKKPKHMSNKYVDFKKGKLFNESPSSDESTTLYRSNSSSNLYEKRDKAKRARKLSSMAEKSPSLFEVLGVTALERDSNHSTPQGVVSLESIRNKDAMGVPSISVTLINDSKMSNDSQEFNKEIQNESIKYQSEKKILELDYNGDESVGMKYEPFRESLNFSETENKNQTSRKHNDSFKFDQIENERIISEAPKMSFQYNIQGVESIKSHSHRNSSEFSDAQGLKTPTNPILVNKTASLEKIINRFKKVRASVIPSAQNDEDIRTIVEEKENFNVNVATANRDLLPDFLSPRFSVIEKKRNDYLDPFSSDANGGKRKPRESLGTALGVDDTFLDQFDLID